MKPSGLQRVPRGRRHREDDSVVDGMQAPRDPAESWRPPIRPELSDELELFKRTGGALPRRAWHLFFLVAAARLDAWAGRDALLALHEDWANFMLCWRRGPSDATGVPGFMTAAFEEMLARPRPPKPRGQPRVTPLAPSVLLAKLELGRLRLEALKTELDKVPLKERRTQCSARLVSVIEEIGAFPFTVEDGVRLKWNGRVPEWLVVDVMKMKKSSLAAVATRIVSHIHAVSSEYLTRKLLPRARKGRGALSDWMNPATPTT